MPFYIQTEQTMPTALSVQTGVNTFVAIPETPHAIQSNYATLVVHAAAGFTRTIHGNNIRPIDGAIYMVGVTFNGDLDISYVGSQD